MELGEDMSFLDITQCTVTQDSFRVSAPSMGRVIDGRHPMSASVGARPVRRQTHFARPRQDFATWRKESRKVVTTAITLPLSLLSHTYFTNFHILPEMK